MAVLNKAAAVKEFSVFESAGPKFKKAVFILSGPVIGSTKTTVQSIIQNSAGLEYVVVVTSCHPSLQTWAQFPGRDWGNDDRTGFDQLEEQLLMWMGNVNFTAEIFHIPVFLVSLTPRLLLTPGSARLFPLLGPDLVRAAALWRTLHPGHQAPASGPGDWPLLPHEVQVSLREVVSGLHSLLATLGAREEIWSVGSLARQLGDQLEAWSPARNRRRTAENRVSLVLVDRSLDLASGVMYGGESLLARATQTLDRLPGHTTDVGVSLARLLGVTETSEEAGQCLLPASLASPGLSPLTEEHELDSLVFDTEKECLSLLYKNLVDKSPKKVNSPSKKYVNISSLDSVLKDFTGDYDSILDNLATVSRAECAVQCAKLEKSDVRRKKMQSLMSQLTRTMCEGGKRVLADMTDLVRGRRDASLRLDDILALLVFVYSSSDVRDAFPQDEEDRLRSVLGEALLKDGAMNNLGPVFEELCVNEGGDTLDEVVALNVVNGVWERLAALKQARLELGSYESLINYEGEFTGLLGQLLADLYHEDRREVTCLHHHAGEGLGAMLRSGLGWLASAPAKPHPRENPWVLVFVLGGVTPREAMESQRLVTGVGRLSVAGTRLLAPHDSLNMAFINNSLMVWPATVSVIFFAFLMLTRVYSMI